MARCAQPPTRRASVGGSGRLRDPRLAVGEHVEVVGVPVAGIARSGGRA